MQQLWDEKARYLHKILNGQVRLVGGCVRDWLLHKKINDRDMATPLTPQEVEDILIKNHIPYLAIGKAFGTIVAKVNGTPFEITTLRKDIQTDGRHAVVGFTKSWATDAKRRDFTINALYADIQGKIYDYTGGLDDLKTKTVRFIGSPKKRMQEDYLRVLRYFRFMGKMGQKKVSEEVVKVLPQIVPHLGHLSVDRRRDELFKMITGPCATHILKVMKKLNVLTPDLLNVAFSKKQRKIFQEKQLEKKLESFGFSGYKIKKGVSNE